MEFFLDVSDQIGYVAAAVEGGSDLVEGLGFWRGVVCCKQTG
jgi:hypothetical protein